MLVIAGIAAAVITVLETLLLLLFPTPGWGHGAILLGANVLLSLVVGYLVFNRGTARQHRTMLNVVPDTLPHLRQGLNPDTATKTARILMQVEQVAGVLITDGTRVLASMGADLADNRFLQEAAQIATRVARSGRLALRQLRRSAAGPATTLLAEPVKAQSGKSLGAVLIVTRTNKPVLADLQHQTNLFSQLVAMQIELGQADRQAQLVAEAELNALRAQINPHFLFNALNTIVSYSRDDPETTRRLLIRLAELFRSAIHSSGQMIPFQEEYHNLTNYLFIEEARFQGKLKIVYDIDPQVLKVPVPALSVQPLVENAVRHGIQKKASPGTVWVEARLDFLSLRAIIRVRDDGVGMTEAERSAALRPRPASGGGGRGVGLSNINERLKRLYGESYHLRLESAPGKGTTATLRIPVR